MNEYLLIKKTVFLFILVFSFAGLAQVKITTSATPSGDSKMKLNDKPRILCDTLGRKMIQNPFLKNNSNILTIKQTSARKNSQTKKKSQYANENNQWIQTNGPYGGLVTSLAVLGSNLFAGTFGGVSLSTNNGTTWIQLTDSPIYVEALAVIGTNLFAGAQDGVGVYLSTNNGTSWTVVTSGLTNTGIEDLAVSGNNLFAATFGGGVYLSTNNGTSWQAVNSGLTNNQVMSLAVEPNGIGGTNIFAGTYFGQVFRSTNNGTSWTAVSDFGRTTSAFVVSPSGTGGTNIFAGTDGVGIFLSTDNGTSWNAVNAGLTDVNVACLTACPNGTGGMNIFAGTYGATFGQNGTMFLSTNNGTNWTAVDNGLTETYINSLAVSGTNIFTGTDGGVFLTTNNGANWTETDNGMINTIVHAFAASGGNIFAGTDGGLFLSTNDGTSWTEVNNGLTNYSVRALAFCGTALFAGTDNGLFRSTNNGTNWTAVNNGLGFYTSISDLAASGTNIFAGTNGNGIYLSTNNGENWVSANSGRINYYTSSIAVSGTSIFASYQLDGVYLSMDNGSSWNAVNTGLTNTWVNTLALCGNNLFAGNDGGIFLSTDGTSWNVVNKQFISVRSLVGSSNRTGSSNVFAGTFGDGIFLSTDTGISWNLVTSGKLNANAVYALTINDGNIFAGTNGEGVWRRPLEEMINSVTKSSSDLPASFSLKQNYPNPFNPSTEISYSLPSATNVKIIIYNSLGQTVKIIVNGYKDAGQHSVNFDAANLPSGIYFYTISADNFIQSKKMILLK